MKTVASSHLDQFKHPHYAYQQAVTHSFSNSLTGDTLLLIQVMCMTPALIFFAVCLVAHLYRKYIFKQDVSQLQQRANLERILQCEDVKR
ncbi:MAG: hypothetical protein F6J95_029070 [Leptolyngbya sp. SIO1E4]|nr:hypothetical protein [Leptolyngbya sp. SIO1E4]